MADRPGDVFDIERLRQLVELMEDHALSEIDLEQAEQRICLRRGPGGDLQFLPQTHAIVQPSAPAPTIPVSIPSGDSGSIITINSPMVGTFYSKPNPEAEPFVKVGDHVGNDTVVCIIEAMKVFNEIQAEVSGRIVAVLVENDEAVEFGKPLFKVDNSK
jgi:acetyl-CoA carboxylase biotin carboxyl carrier protein